MEDLQGFEDLGGDSCELGDFNFLEDLDFHWDFTKDSNLDRNSHITEIDIFNYDDQYWSHLFPWSFVQETSDFKTTSTSESNEVSSDSDFLALIPSSPSPMPTEFGEESSPVESSAFIRPLKSHKSPLKRKWDQSIVVFPSKPDEKVVFRKRKPFDRQRRREVATHRLVGACIQCKLRKGSCNLGMPCNICIKRAGSVALGQELCTRQSLMSVRFNNIDLFGVTKFGIMLKEHQYTMITETRRDIHIFWPNYHCYQAPPKHTIKVQVQDFKDPNGSESDPREQTILCKGYRNYYHEYLVKDSRTVITPENLPLLNDLEVCGKYLDHGCASGPFIGLHRAFAHFADLYCDLAVHLPLQTVMRKCVRMKRLISTFQLAAKVNGPGAEEAKEFVSSWIKLQLRHHIGQGIIKLEAEILTELDQLLYGQESIGRRNPLATWVCLWVLLLAYKGQMWFVHFHHLHSPEQLQSRYGLAKHIYNTLTAIYSALYKTTSPLTFDWRVHEISEMLGRDPDLIKAFCNIKTEMYWFHGAKNELLNEDALFRTLVVENESKLLETYKKIARRQGLI